jgi:cytochrome c
LRTLKGHKDNVNAVAFSPDGKLLMSAGYDTALMLWRVADGTLLSTLRGHEYSVNAVSFTPDGRRAVSVSSDETLRVWDLETGEDLEVIRGHDGPVLGVAVSSDGRQAASAGLDGTIRLWDLETGTGLAVLEGHQDPVWSLRYTPDGGRLISAGADEVLRVWDLANAREIANGVDGIARAATWDDGSRGAQLFRKCSACHTVGEDGGNKAGPTLYGLFGRPFGRISGYRYSDALKDSDLVWNATTIDALFAEGPQHYVPGSKMPLQRMPNAADRAELITFLKRITAPQP